MHIIETLYILGAVVAIVAAYPQLRQLLKLRASDEFNVATWATWLVTQCITFVYVASLGNKLMMLVNIGWIAFYFTMTVLIIYYHPIRRKRTDEAVELETELEPEPDLLGD